MTDEQRASAGRFIFVGGLLALDFANTEFVDSGETVDRLTDPSALIDWLEAAEVLDAGAAKSARARWAEGPDGERILASARALRAAVRAAAERLADGERPDAAAVEAINLALADAVRVWRVVATASGDGYEQRGAWDFSTAPRLLGPIADSARELLCERDASLVRRCRNSACVLLFYDATKNHGRAWCSMAMCGNRAKASAHYRRRRDPAGA